MSPKQITISSIIAVLAITTGAQAQEESQQKNDRLEKLREARRLAIEVDVPLPSADDLKALPEVSFTQDIKPLLSNNCFACHGPDEGSRQASVRLDQRDEATRRNRTGKAPIVPGDLSQSRMAWRLFHPDPALRMPPADSEKRLSDEQRLLLARWIMDGAEYAAHWAYQPIEGQPIEGQLIEGQLASGSSAVGNEVDTFVRERLAQHGFEISPLSDPQTLARRLTLDLLGLPPTTDALSEIVDAFLADPSEASYQQLVDDLLASPHYGERMALHWLDLVRYADTNGYHSDEPRSVSPYRDWVIRAFNNNMPFDRFTIEQLAGDLLEEPTTDQLIAATFNRLNQLTAEGGAQEREYRAKYNADRVRAVSTVWMGATLGCAECHDHKFDPYLQRDFYSMAAFFADIDEFDVYTTGETWDPLLILPTDEQAAESQEIEQQLRELERTMATAELSEEQAAWERRILLFVKDQGDTALPGWHPVTPTDWQTEGSELELQPDLSLLATGPKPPGDVYTVEFETNSSMTLRALRMEVLGHPSLKGGFSRAIRSSAELCELELERLTADGSWQQVLFNHAVDERKSKIELVIDGTTSSRWTVRAKKPIDDRVEAAFFVAQPLEIEPATRLRVRLTHHGLNNRVAFGRFRFSLSSDRTASIGNGQRSTAMIPTEGVPGAVLTILGRDISERSREEREAVSSFYRTIAPSLSQAREQWVALHERHLEIERQSMSTLLTRSLAEPRDTHILERGNWLKPGEKVTPAVPGFLPDLVARGARPDRLDLAHWLINDRNPLTARVVTNRLFKLFFGQGLSTALDDLGSQGGPPSHPQLLDSLARSYVDSGWDTKQLIRTLVLSDTYRQKSRPRPELRDLDPYNRLLARQQPQRLEAEFVRDNALAISGLLAEQVGGPSVRPYQPAGYWRNANTFGGSSLVYEPSAGNDQYRRGLYTYWKRSFLHPSLLNFDAPSREECTAMREVSNTPLQALTLLNDPTYVEAARVLAEKTLREGGPSESERIHFLFERSLLRAATADEVSVLSQLLDRQLREYRRDSEAARALTSIGQAPIADDLDPALLAAWTQVTRTVLNLPEVITRF